jgi:CBS domain-containing protein
MELRKLTITSNASIRDGVLAIQESHTRCVIAVNESQMVVGVLSEGDILRAMLEGVSLDAPIQKIVRPSFISLREKSLKQASTIVQKKLITLIPVIDENFRLLDAITLREVIDFLSGEKHGAR